MNGIKKIFCMFVVSNAKRQIKHLVVGAFFYAYYSAYAVNIQGYQTPLTDCFTTLYCDCLLAKTEGDSLSLFNNFNFIRKMPKDNEITNSTKYSNTVSTPHSATTVQFNRNQIGFKPQNSQNPRGKKHKITQITQEPVKETNQYAEIVSKAFFEFLQDEAENITARADANFKDKINAARLLFSDDRKNLKNYLKSL